MQLLWILQQSYLNLYIGHNCMMYFSHFGFRCSFLGKTIPRSLHLQWDPHVLQTYNSLRDVCRFWRIVMALERVRSMLPRVYIPYERALPSSLKGAKITVIVRRLITKVVSSSGLILSLREILHHINSYTARLTLFPLVYDWFLIENMLLKAKK